MPSTSCLPCRMRAVVLVAAAVIAGCAAPRRVDTEMAPAADFSARRTFAWQESQASYDPQPASPDVEAVKRTIRDAVVEQLLLKGFREVEGAAPDFLVSFHLVVTVMTEPELCVRRHVIFAHPGTPGPLRDIEVCEVDTLARVRTLRQGTLVVFVVDPATHTLLWQGAAVGAAVSRGGNSESLRAAVTQMLAEFPSAPV